MNIIVTSGDAKKADVAKELCEKTPLFEKPYDFEAVVAHIRQALAQTND